jgi:hypothetical protein
VGAGGGEDPGRDGGAGGVLPRGAQPQHLHYPGPIDPSLAKTLRRKTYFDDEPSRLLCIDIDGAQELWLPI